MSQQNKTQLQSTINTNVADNTVGDISAADIRNPLIDLTDSLLFNSGSQTFDGTLTATAFSGDGSAITGVTGEWDGTLNGNAEITGSLIVSSSVVDFTDATAISGSTFSGSFVGDGSGLTGIDNDPFPYTGNASITGRILLDDGNDNVGVGIATLNSLSSGNYNTTIGSNALVSLATGGSNIAIGSYAGASLPGGLPLLTADESIFIGDEAKPNSNSGTNQIVIGSSLTGNGSNTVTIGNSSITNNYFEGDVSATSFTGNGATISGSLIASGSVVDFTDAIAISGSTFSGSFVGDGSGLTLPATSGTAKMFSGVFAENSGVSLALTTERNDFDSTSPLIANRLGVGYYVFTFSVGAFNLNSSSTVYSFQPDPNSGTVSVGFYSADTQGSNQLYIFARDTTGAMADGVLDDVEFRITQFTS